MTFIFIIRIISQMQREYSKEVLINSLKNQTEFSLSGAKTDPHTYRLKGAIVLDLGRFDREEFKTFC